MHDLQEQHLLPDPIAQFIRWLDDARAAGIAEAEAMTLATASRAGRPSARIVLLKKVAADGFTFYTNYRSRKGRDLAENPYAALIFYWEHLGRQVRVEGSVARVPAAESDAYFASRPLPNQLSSLVSPQSERIDRDELDRTYERMRAQFEGKSVPRPADWGGYRVSPDRIEFWQRRFARLNDRIAYERQEGGLWEMHRLAP